MSSTPTASGSHADPNAAQAPETRRLKRIGWLIIVVTGLSLYLPGINWGLPTTVSWSQDTISDIRTLGAVAQWPEHWNGRYQPLHYLILNAAYQPILAHWRGTGDYRIDQATGQMTFSPPHHEKTGLLILVARLIAVAMAIAAGIGIWRTAHLLTGDAAAGIIAALLLMTGAAYAHFAHLGNVDIPSICWFSWSAYFFARLLRSTRWYDAALLGLFGAMAVSTKDAVAGMYPGMAIVLIVTAYRSYRRDHSPGRAWWRAVARPKWVLGAAAFLLPYLWLYGALSNWDGYAVRMKGWLDPDPSSLHAAQHRYATQIGLLIATMRYAAGAVGWPLLLAMVASTAYTLKRHRRLALSILTPVVGYYLIVLCRIDFVYSRFLFAPLALLGILTARAATDWWRSPRVPATVKVALPVLVMLPTLGYTVALDAEMITETRYDAERWFAQHVEPPSSVGAFAMRYDPSLRPQYLPRLHDQGYASFPIVMTRESFDRPQPEYLVLTSYNYDDFDQRQRECLRDLLTGALGYELVVSFRGRFLGTGRSWLALAGWGAPVPGKISPELTILHRSAKVTAQHGR